MRNRNQFFHVSTLVLALMLVAVAQADELSDAFDQLKAAEAANDGAGIKQWAVETSRLARAELALPPPEAESQQAYYAEKLIYLEQTDVYTEYAMAVGAGQPGVAPEQVIDLVDTLIAQKAESEYLSLAVSPYLVALEATGGMGAQLEGAQKILTLLPDNEDAWMATAEIHRAQSQHVQAIDDSGRVVAALEGKAMPEGYAEETWEQKKKSLLGRANLIAGLGTCEQEEWARCDAYLREAEFYIGGDEPVVDANIFFYLGWANYQIALDSGDQERMDEAAAYSRQSAKIDSPLKEQAEKNAEAISRQMAR